MNNMGTVKVGRKGDRGAEYIGRGSPLGNPYPVKDQSDAERDRVCVQYDTWLDRQIAAKNREVMAELNRLARLARRPEGVLLGCFCAPKRCHGDRVKAEVEKILALDQKSPEIG